MRKISIALLMFGWVLLAMPAVAGDGEGEMPEMLSMSHQVWVQPGSELDFEKGLKDHMAMHAAAGEPWTWEAWMQVTGKGTGSYFVRSGGHSWADFDIETEIEGDREHLSTVMSHAKWSQTKINKWDLDISRWPEGDAVPKMVEITEFHLKHGAVKDFYHAIKQVHKLIGEKELDYQYAWGWTVSGGSGPSMMLAVPHDSWADFEAKEPGMWEVAEEEMGRTGAGNLRDAINNSITEQKDYVVVYRPDLSYSPAGK